MTYIISMVIALAFAGNPTLDINPGVSFGDAVIGEKKESLIKKGYTRDYARPDHYYEKLPLHVRLEKDVVVQIWFENIELPQKVLRYKGKSLPTKPTVENLIKFFGDCEKPKKASGGLQVHCSNGGIELSTLSDRPDIFLSVMKK